MSYTHLSIIERSKLEDQGFNENGNRPCKCLGWIPANEAFMNELSHIA